MSIFIFILLVFVHLLLLVFALYTFRALKSGAPFLPTRKKHIRTMLELMTIGRGTTLMDLGSGDGRIVFFIAKHTSAKAIGVELNPLLYMYAMMKRFFSKQKSQILFLKKDLWSVDLSEVDVLTLFFIKQKMPALEEKIKKEMRPGSQVISYLFSFEGWQPEKKHGSIFLYRV